MRAVTRSQQVLRATLVGASIAVLAGGVVAARAASPASSASSASRLAAAASPSGGGSAGVVMNPATSYAVVVGISNYAPPTHPTYGGLGDAATFHKLLSQAGWDDSHVRVLTDATATASAIRSAMRWLVSKSGPNTFTVFHYSGHVRQADGHEFLWGVDNAFIRDDEFGAALQPLQGRSWVDISGCEAAAFNSGISSPARLFTGSSRITEKSYEEPAWKQSVWTGLSVEQAILQYAADANGDGAVSVQEAVGWAQERAAEYTARQTPNGPQHPVLTGGDGPWYLGPNLAPAALVSPSGGDAGSGTSPTTAPAPSGSGATSTPPKDLCATVTLGLVKTCPGTRSA